MFYSITPLQKLSDCLITDQRSETISEIRDQEADQSARKAMSERQQQKKKMKRKKRFASVNLGPKRVYRRVGDGILGHIFRC